MQLELRNYVQIQFAQRRVVLETAVSQDIRQGWDFAAQGFPRAISQAEIILYTPRIKQTIIISVKIIIKHTIIISIKIIIAPTGWREAVE